MQGAEYQALAMRTNDKKSTDRLLNKINDLKMVIAVKIHQRLNWVVSLMLH